MNRSFARATAALVGAGLALTVMVAGAGSASAAETPVAPLAFGEARPVDPQPVVAGHEGDVLMQVNVVMASQAAPAAKLVRKAKNKH